MKSFKNLLLVLFFFTANLSFAQIKNAKTETVKVWGNCGMCKSKIEKAANQKNISSAVWNEDTKEAKITYNTKLTSLSAVLKKIALVGYDNEMFAAPTEVYEKLHGCCQYDRPDNKKEKAKKIEKEEKVETKVIVKEEASTNQNTVDQLLNAYLKIKDALVNSNAANAASASAKLFNLFKNINMESLGQSHMTYMKLEESLKQDAEHISETTEISHQRDHFTSLSKNLFEVIKSAKINTTVYYDYCPMFNNGKGANWLSKDAAIKNPYYGSMMLGCGKVQETIKQ